MSTAPWWTYPRIDNFGTIDPQGPFWKPDSNIQIPGHYPIIAISPGTVTDVRQTTYGGQTAVTVKLDMPLNSLATHEYYEHMSSAAVAVGQRIGAGTLIGYNNPTGAVPLGFGFYSGDVYGSGPAWGVLQNDLRPGGAGLLNPVKFLDSAKGGTIPTGSGGYGVLNPPIIAGTAPDLVSGLQGFAVKAGIFLIGLILLLFGAYLLFKPQVDTKLQQGGHMAKTMAKIALL